MTKGVASNVGDDQLGLALIRLAARGDPQVIARVSTRCFLSVLS
jgi:hypothetical protein